MKLKKKEISQIETLQQSWQQNKKITKQQNKNTPFKPQSTKNIDELLPAKQYHPIKVALDETNREPLLKPFTRTDKKIPLKYLNYFNSKNRVHTEMPNDNEFPIISFSKNITQYQFAEEGSKLVSHPIKRKTQQKVINKNTMLLNEMIQILKNGSNQSPTNSKYRNLTPIRPKRIMTEGTYQNFNQFIEKDARKRMFSSKNARPVIIQNEISRVSNLGNTVIRRNLKSQQKQRRKVYTMQKKPSQNTLPKDNKQIPELLTFYGNIKINIANGNVKEQTQQSQQHSIPQMQSKTYTRKIIRNQFPRNQDMQIRNEKSIDDDNQFI